MKDKQFLYTMYNATSTDDDGEIETYENWLERQLLNRINQERQLTIPDITGLLPTQEQIEIKFPTDLIGQSVNYYRRQGVAWIIDLLKHG
jgi:hypothetical protein